MMRRTPLRSKSVKPKKRDPSKVPEHNRKESDRKDQKALDACRGEDCYIMAPGICKRVPGDPTVVPAHQNFGKGMGLKVPDKFTVPACGLCHAHYDTSGTAREVKRALWDWAYTRWLPVRKSKIGY